MTENYVDDNDGVIKNFENILKSSSSSNKIVKDLNMRKQNARNRWKLLAKAILCESKNEETIKRLSITPTINVISNIINGQIFDGFDLVKIEQLEKDDTSNLIIKIDVGYQKYECNVHFEKLWTVKDLIGFNNTGNITFWTSEAALCHYAMENISIFDNAWVLELGGGMFCLCGIMIAKYGKAFAVHLTDGNQSSIQNVKKSVNLNNFDCFTKCSVLRWEDSLKQCPLERQKYNFILCADCLFFDDSRAALVDSIFYFLSEDGMAFVIAPKRGLSMSKFIKRCIAKGLNCEIVTYYNKEIWEKHQKFQKSSQYNEDIHYPVLLKLCHMKKTDYWKSQNRIFCDFCKCWITDNKPSIEFHNTGKRHKANVQQRINDIGKKSDADRKTQSKFDEDLRKINEAAMKSYAKDISSGTDITSRAIGHASSSKKAVDPIALPFYEEEDGPSVSKKPHLNQHVAQNAAKASSQSSSLWCEAVSEEGHTYYWNIKTNESVWEKPKEGYMTLSEYNKLNQLAITKQEEEAKKDFQYHVENADELAAKYKREQYKKYQTITQEPKTTESSTSECVNYSSSQPYGNWETVEDTSAKKPIDLELPTQNNVYYAVASVKPDDPPIKKFKEKTIDTQIGSSEIPSVFKKRKIGNRNIRRTNDDSV